MSEAVQLDNTHRKYSGILTVHHCVFEEIVLAVKEDFRLVDKNVP
jgi:hypothetical protein